MLIRFVTVSVLAVFLTTPTAAEDWSEHIGDVPFVIGLEAGEKEAEFTGKPMMLFFTATW